MSNWTFLNQHRVGQGIYASDASCGFNGAFIFPLPGEARAVYCIASDASACPKEWPKWRHVSVSFGPASSKTPSWEIMDRVKNLFWDEDDTVIQLHPPRSQWINNHPGCLHLWQPLEEKQPLPPSIYVGLKELNPREDKRG